jgi:hypothetical protein
VRLTVETGPLAGTVINLERETPALLGSGPGSALRIQEAGVIEQHAVVKALKGPGFGIKATGSVKVNGKDVQACPLTDGDVIEIGTTRIAFGKTQDRGLPSISGYRIIEILGKGGMGTVYRAEQVSLHREVALKVLKQEQTSDPEFIAQFVAEARAAAKLQHPNVVSVFDVEHDGDTYYYAMELMHDGSCEDWLKQNGVMPVDRALQVVADAAAGLAYAESLGIVHRDIKPDNLMLDQHGSIKIADLGLASNSSDAAGERAIGTPHFMAPEQVLNKELDHRTDLYALGCTFYRLVTGKTPFRGQTVKDILRAQVKEQAEPASRANSDVTPEVATIIQQLMAKEPSDRYQTANDLLEDLEELLQPQQKRGMWIGLAAAAVLIAGGTVWWAVTRPETVKTITETVVYDDPEKQQFADRIKALEGEAAQKDATIALLSAQISDLSGEALAASFDRVAIEHPNTKAADEAIEIAATIRKEVAVAAEQRKQRRARIADHIAAMRRGTIQPLDAHDYERALRALDVAPPEDIGADKELLAGMDKVRAEVLTKARAYLTSLSAPLAAAQASKDEAKLAAAIATLEAGIDPLARWPKEIQPDVASAKETIKTARAGLVAMEQKRRQGIWQDFRSLLQEASGFRAHLSKQDFLAASASLTSFATRTEANAASARAKGLAQCAEHASEFAAALSQSIDKGDLRLTIDKTEHKVNKWDREAQRLTVRASRRKEQALDCREMSIDQWISLANQVEGASQLNRNCFLSMVTIDTHCRAAKAYLSQLNRASDDTGTGEQAYPYAAVTFERLLNKLPRTEDAWATVLGDELQAGKRLASGLRALSEKRNTAAAGHIEKLLADHPHSLVVAILP